MNMSIRIIARLSLVAMTASFVLIDDGPIDGRVVFSKTCKRTAPIACPGPNGARGEEPRFSNDYRFRCLDHGRREVASG
jgi:hypothetical protein